MVETLQRSEEFERKPNREIEKKYLPLFPEQLAQFRAEATPIEQLYLSHPKEDFNLRLRESAEGDELTYKATLKDAGSLTPDGLDRLEIETAISPETYAYYKAMELPTLRKLRAEPHKNIVIDWFKDGHVQLESEQPISWAAFVERYGLRHDFADITGDRMADNEWRAHLDYRQRHDGREAFVIEPELDTEIIVRNIWKHQRQSSQTIVTIAGRSGSGKSTVIRDIVSRLEQNDIRSVVLSTDDYHRGKAWLNHYKGSEWTDWDAPIVYNLDALQADVAHLRNSQPIARQRFDFEREEPVLDGIVEPAPVIFIEGIYARHLTFDAIANFRHELPTSLATCIGRRLLRDMKERPQFADPEKSLRYMLENAEPSYRAQLA